ncbi:propanediol utilization protein, partial [Salmonella enterica subsp. enterica serovar Infantis]
DLRLDLHIETDEANAAGADNPQALARLVGPR